MSASTHARAGSTPVGSRRYARSASRTASFASPASALTGASTRQASARFGFAPTAALSFSAALVSVATRASQTRTETPVSPSIFASAARASASAGAFPASAARSATRSHPAASVGRRAAMARTISTTFPRSPSSSYTSVRP